MKKIIILGSLLASSSVFAETNSSYFGASFHLGTYEEDGIDTVNPISLSLEGGKYIAENLALEANILLGIQDDSVTSGGIEADIGVKHAISFFLKGDLDLNEINKLYGLLGYSKGKLEATFPQFDNASVTESDSGLSYGVGFESELTPEVSAKIEYIMYLSEDDYDYSGINIGFSKLL